MIRPCEASVGTPEGAYSRANTLRGAAATLGGLLLISTSSTALAQSAVPSSPSAPANNSPSASDAPGGQASDQRAQLEDIVVTANKRTETLSKVPAAVSALPPSVLQTAGIVGIQDLNSIAPNTEIRTVGVDNGALFAIRGISNTEFNDNANPAVATYIDGVYVGRTEGLASSLYDLDRIEILRGPQGTLYGRNATGGNVNILTATPTHAFHAEADVSYGSYNDLQAHGMINVPVTDTLAVRGAFTFHRSDGYYNTEGTSDRYGKAEDRAGRITLLWTPSTNFTWRLSVDDFVSHGTPSLDVLTGPDGKPQNGRSPYDQPFTNIQQPYFFTEPRLSVNNLMIRSKMDFIVREGVTLTYTAGYQHVKDQPDTVLAFPDATTGERTYAPFSRNTPAKSTSQELDLNADFGRFHNIAGANYYYQHFYDQSDANNLAGTFFIAHGDAFIKAYGVFDQATFDLTNKLKITGGVRYSHEKDSEKNDFFSFCALNTYNPPNNTLQQLAQQQFSLPGCLTIPGISGGQSSAAVTASHVDYRSGLEYAPSESTSGYLTVTSGFKAGGLNLGPSVPTDSLSFKPERATNYELGVKTRLLDNRLGINLAIFDTEYKSIQISQLSRDATADVTTNAGAARIYGLELEAQWRIGTNDRLSGSFNYLHAKYTNYRNAVDELSNITYPSLNGNYLPFAPRFSGRFEYAHSIPLANGAKITGTGSIYLQSVNYLRQFNLPIDRVPSYTKSDIQVEYLFPEEHFAVTGYIHNVEDHAVRNGAFPYLAGYLSSYDAPRTYGLRISYNY